MAAFRHFLFVSNGVPCVRKSSPRSARAFHRSSRHPFLCRFNRHPSVRTRRPKRGDPFRDRAFVPARHANADPPRGLRKPAVSDHPINGRPTKPGHLRHLPKVQQAVGAFTRSIRRSPQRQRPLKRRGDQCTARKWPTGRWFDYRQRSVGCHPSSPSAGAVRR